MGGGGGMGGEGGGGLFSSLSRSSTAVALLPQNGNVRKIEKVSKNYETTWVLVTTVMSHRAGLTNL